MVWSGQPVGHLALDPECVSSSCAHTFRPEAVSTVGCELYCITRQCTSPSRPLRNSLEHNKMEGSVSRALSCSKDKVKRESRSVHARKCDLM